MICYKDKWWCKKYKQCKNPCTRALTEQVQADADKWWESWGSKDETPIDVDNNPRCFKEIV